MIRKSNIGVIKFYFLVKPFKFANRNELKTAITALFKLETTNFSALTYIFCSDPYLLEINNAFLHHNYFTDVLTFDLSDDDDMTIGEIYISVERVKDNASRLNETFTDELHRVIFHAALHLCGYKDKTKKDLALMRSKEDYYLQLLK